MTSDLSTTPPRRRLSIATRAAATTVFLIVAAAVAVGAHAQGLRHGPGGPGMMIFEGPPEHTARAVDRLLDGLGATDAQRTQIQQIAVAAASDLKAQRSGGKALHDQALQVFTAPTVDARAAETLRQQMSAQRDQASKRILQAMLDMAQVLTPDQRARVADRIRQHDAASHDRAQRARSAHTIDQPPR